MMKKENEKVASAVESEELRKYNDAIRKANIAIKQFGNGLDSSGKKKMSITLTGAEAEAIKEISKLYGLTPSKFIGGTMLLTLLTHDKDAMAFMNAKHNDLLMQIIAGV